MSDNERSSVYRASSLQPVAISGKSVVARKPRKQAQTVSTPDARRTMDPAREPHRLIEERRRLDSGLASDDDRTARSFGCPRQEPSYGFDVADAIDVARGIERTL